MSSRVLGVGIATVLATLVAAAPQGAVAQQLVKLATKDAALKDNTVTIDITGAKGSFSAIRVYNKGAPVKISNVRVVYGDDSFHNEQRPISLLKGERTRQIDPRKANKFVDTVIVTYEPTGANDVAKLEVWGEQDGRGSRDVRPKKGGAAPAPAPEAKPKTPGPVAAPANPVEAPKPSAPVPAEASAEPAKPIESTKWSGKGRCVGEGNLLLAKTNVGVLGVDRDTIRVNGKFGLFDRIRLCVDGADIDLQGLTVSFTDGSKYSLPYAGLIKDGHRTQAMGLKGDHFIDSVLISYKRKDFRAGANVEIWGELSDRWLDEESRLHNDGWVKLGSGQTAGFVGFDLDRFEAPKFKKGFSDVRVVVKNRDITLDHVTLIYTDGKTQKFDAGRARVEPEKGFGPLKIEGGKKLIKEVEARYRSRFFDRGAKGQESAVVEFWAK